MYSSINSTRVRQDRQKRAQRHKLIRSASVVVVSTDPLDNSKLCITFILSARHCCLHGVSPIHIHMQWQSFHEEAHKQPKRPERDHHLPEGLHRFHERFYDLFLDVTGKRWDNLDERIDNRGVRREAGDDTLGQVVFELILDDSSADSDAPSL